MEDWIETLRREYPGDIARLRRWLPRRHDAQARSHDMYDRLIPERIHPWGDEDLLEATEQDRTCIVQAAPVRRLQQKTRSFRSM